MESRIKKTGGNARKAAVSVLSMLLALLMLFSVCSVVAFADEEAKEDMQTTVTNARDSIRREINVVFDNSSSMYQNTDRWCYAKYAMEAFVAMLNPNDVLRVYTLNPVTTTGRNSGSTDPIVISGADKTAGIDLIHNMYSTKANGNTHFPPVQNAASGFKGENTVKYLVILSDGMFTEDTAAGNAKALDTEYVNTEIEKIAARSDLNMLYLIMGAKSSSIEAPSLKMNEACADQGAIIQGVNKVCNYIFGRNELDDDYYDESEIELEISMKNLIVFVQGANANIGAISSSDGKSYTPKVQKITYSDKSSPDTDIKVNESLNGCIATFENVPSGEYKINYSGEITVFYEPDIDVAYNLIDNATEKAVVPNEKGEIDSGEYTIDLFFVDAMTGADITDSDLIKGKNDNTLSATVKIEGQEDRVVEDGAPVVLTANKNTEIKVKGTYLDDYTITGSGKNGLGDFKVVDNPFKCEISVGNDYFCTINADSWESFVISFEIDKRPATADDLAKIKITSVEIKDGKKDYPIKYELTEDKAEGCYKLKLKIPEGKSAASVCGKGTITVNAEYQLGGGVATDHDKISFEISTIPQWAKILIICGSILGTIGLIAFILTRKVYPKHMWLDVNGRTFKIQISRGSASLRPAGARDGLELSLKPSCTVFDLYFKKKPSVFVDGVKPSAGIKNFSLKGNSYVRNTNGSWPEEVEKFKKKMKIVGNSNECAWVSSKGSCSGVVKFKR
ncbi:MAG: hypothetical protein IKV76_09925 [Clostridia bacterium]|nr:hypothetical protein [Clostridia bacterium]